ncbi:MAG: 4Fe-4S dicluster domain-containing protein [Myxococcota bacterium]|nr:4Fe-4S dicluster domain-containing protein [Myxococcota bacterium]
MGHLSSKNTYMKLQDRLERYPVGAPGQRTIYEILSNIYTPEEAEIASRMPMMFSSLKALSKKLGIEKNALEKKLNKMADKGIVMDLRFRDKVRYLLSPTMVGLFEFSMMRIRDDMDQKRLSELFHRYIVEEPAFISQFGEGIQTTLFRTLVHEKTIAPENYTEVLDWERATHVVSEAGRWAVGICHCRHVAHHLDRDCNVFPMENTCLTLGEPVVDYLTRHNIATEIEKSQALDLIAQSRESLMVHTCDNVQQRPAFVCNCCGCCCEIMLAFKNFKSFGNMFSSNFEAVVGNAACTGCKKCNKACPVDAIDMTEQHRTVGKKKYKFLARVNKDLCLGCGVCVLACKHDAMKMAPRPQRRIIPESTFTRILTMAVEQGTVHELLFDKNDGITAATANALLGAILSLSPAKRLLANQVFKSRFVDFMFSRAQKQEKSI